MWAAIVYGGERLPAENLIWLGNRKSCIHAVYVAVDDFWFLIYGILSVTKHIPGLVCYVGDMLPLSTWLIIISNVEALYCLTLGC